MKFLGLNRGSLGCETNAQPLHYLLAWVRWKKSSVYKHSMHFCQENIEWSGSGVEQKSGISHLFNLSKIDCAGF